MRGLLELEWLVWEKTIGAIGGAEAIPLLLLPGGKTMLFMRLLAALFRSSHPAAYLAHTWAVARMARHGFHLLLLAALVSPALPIYDDWAQAIA